MAGDKKKDPEKQLVEAMRAFVRQSKGAAAREEEEEAKPNWIVFIVLAIVSVDLGIMILAIEAWVPPLAAAIKVGVPVVFGVGLLGYQKTMREILFKKALHKGFIALAILPLTMHGLAFIPLPVPIRAPEMGQITVDGADVFNGYQDTVITIRGIRPHEIVVEEIIDGEKYSDTYRVTRRDLIKGFGANFHYWRNRYHAQPLSLPTPRTVFIDRGDSTETHAIVLINGEFGPTYLDGKNRRRTERTLSIPLEKGLATKQIRLPEGKYEVYLKRGGCEVELVDSAFVVITPQDLNDPDVNHVDAGDVKCRPKVK